MKNRKDKRNGHNPYGTGAVLGENVGFTHVLHETLKNGTKDIINQAQRYRNNTTASMTGFVAESDHCATFNARKALERSPVRAVREANGHHGDYRIVKIDPFSKEETILREGEVKYYKTAEATEQAMRGYGDKQLVGPSDQVGEIVETANRKASKNHATGRESRIKVAQEHEEVARHVSDSISDGKTRSTPRTREEMEKIAKRAKKGDISEADILPPPEEGIKKAGLSGIKAGCKIGLIFNLPISSVKNFRAYRKGEKDVTEALVDTGLETLKGTLDCAAKGGAASAATAGSIYLAEKASNQLIKRALNSSLPAGFAIASIEIGKKGLKYLNGEADLGEFLEESGKVTVTSAGSMALAEAGAFIGTIVCPGIGTVVGGIIGGIGGSLGIDYLLKKIF